MKKITMILMTAGVALLPQSEGYASNMQGLKAVLEDYQKKQSLKDLIIENVPLHTFDTGQYYAESGIAEDKNNSINLSDENLKDDDIQILTQKILTDSEREHIQVLNLANNQLTDLGAINIATIIGYLPNLEELDIRGNPFSLLGLQTILLKSSTFEDMRTIRCSVAENDLPQLEKITQHKISLSSHKNHKDQFEALLERKL